MYSPFPSDQNTLHLHLKGKDGKDGKAGNKVSYPHWFAHIYTYAFFRAFQNLFFYYLRTTLLFHLCNETVYCEKKKTVLMIIENIIHYLGRYLC